MAEENDYAIYPATWVVAWRLGMAEGAVRVLTDGITRLNEYQSWRHAYGPGVTKQSNEKQALNGVLINDDDYAVDDDGEDALFPTLQESTSGQKSILITPQGPTGARSNENEHRSKN
uniref:Uncharacterized protein n=1 Tax=Glossina palpalis gambiensis TaxID=67801 RepID=A0A1B0BQA7_9MUSC